MSFMDATVFVLATSLVMMVFVTRTNIDKSRVRVKVKANRK
nr:hypothetical protein BHI3_20620 [Bacteriovorax sp. HI3]